MSENKPSAGRRRDRNPRRTFSVREQMHGKLGPEGLDRLLTELERTTRKPRRRNRAQVSA